MLEKKVHVKIFAGKKQYFNIFTKKAAFSFCPAIFLDAYVFIFYRTQVSLGSDLWVMISLTLYKTICRLKGEVRQKLKSKIKNYRLKVFIKP